MIPDNYRNKMPIPTLEQFTTYNLYFKGEVLGRSVSRQDRDQIKTQYPTATIEKEADTVGYEKAKTAYKEEASRLEKLFWEDLAAEYEVSNHPKRATLEKIVKLQGGSFEDQVDFYELLLELIK